VVHGPRKKPLVFSGNPDHVMLGLAEGLRLPAKYPACVDVCHSAFVTVLHQRPWRRYICALLSAVLVKNISMMMIDDLYRSSCDVSNNNNSRRRSLCMLRSAYAEVVNRYTR